MKVRCKKQLGDSFVIYKCGQFYDYKDDEIEGYVYVFCNEEESEIEGSRFAISDDHQYSDDDFDEYFEYKKKSLNNKLKKIRLL